MKTAKTLQREAAEAKALTALMAKYRALEAAKQTAIANKQREEAAELYRQQGVVLRQAKPLLEGGYRWNAWVPIGLRDANRQVRIGFLPHIPKNFPFDLTKKSKFHQQTRDLADIVDVWRGKMTPEEAVAKWQKEKAAEQRERKWREEVWAKQSITHGLDRRRRIAQLHPDKLGREQTPAERIEYTTLTRTNK